MSLPKCETKFCRGLCLPSGKSPKFSKCRSRQWRENHPLKYVFQKLRYRAKERGHAFVLTFAEYEKFAIETGYAALKGKSAHSLSIHRKDDAGPYALDNIAAVSLSMNSRLQFSNMPDYLKAEMEVALRGGRPAEVST